MTKYKVYVNASIVAGIVAAMAISSTLLTTNSVLASLGKSSNQKKNVNCPQTTNEWHTRNYCDGYYLGRADCNSTTSEQYRGNSSSHTENWKDGYKRGWTAAGCVIP